MEIWDLNSTKLELKNLIPGFKNRLDQVEERISQSEESSLEIIHPEE